MVLLGLIFGLTIGALTIDARKKTKNEPKHCQEDDEPEIHHVTYCIRLGGKGFSQNEYEENLIKLIRYIRDICEDERVYGDISIPVDEHSPLLVIHLDNISEDKFGRIYKEFESKRDEYFTCITFTIERA